MKPHAAALLALLPAALCQPARADVTPPPANVSFANPTAHVGTAAANGTASTAMRADAAPALDLAMAPTMTGAWAWNPAANTTPLTVSGYSLTGSNAQSLMSLAGTLNTSGTPDVVKIAVTDTSLTAATNYFAVYGGAGGNQAVLRATNHLGVAVGTIDGSGTFELGASADLNTAQGVITGQAGYLIIKAENDCSASTCRWPYIQLLSSNGSELGSIYNVFGGGANSSAASSSTGSAWYVSNVSSGTQTDWLKIPTSGILELHSSTLELGAAIAEGAASTYDTNISRLSAGVVAVGNGTAGDASGTLRAAAYNVGGTAGASCTLTAIAHLTVVNGIVTGCE